MIIAVGSTNKTKIDPVKKIFRKHFPNAKVVGVSVPSGVSDQPKSNEEMYQGALNRAKGALKQTPDAEYGVGVEGGVHKYSFGWFEYQMIVIVDRKGDIGIGTSSGLMFSQKIMDHLEKGKDLNQAVEELTGIKNIGHQKGLFGLISHDVVTRGKAIEHGVALALGRFLHPELF